MTDIYNLFKFLEDKKGMDIPLRAKLRLNLDNINSNDISKIYKHGAIRSVGPVKFIYIYGIHLPLDDNNKIKNINLWFDEVDYFKEEVIIVKKNHKGYNLINANGDLISPDLWFDEVKRPNMFLEIFEGFFRVHIKNKGWNFMNTKGEILSSDLWFDDVSRFKEGFANVSFMNDEGWYLINEKGEIFYDDKKTRLTPEEIEELKK